MGKSQAPTTAEVPHVNGFPRYTEPEMQRRHTALRALMEEQELAAVLIVGAAGPLETSVQYYTNWSPLTESHCILSAGGNISLFVRLWNHLPDARLIAAFDEVGYAGDSPDEASLAVAAALKAHGVQGKRYGVIGPLRHRDATLIAAELPGAELVDLNAEYRALRLVKSEEELGYMRIAAAFNDRAVEAMEAQIKPRINEREIAQMVEDTYLSEGAVNLIHFTLSTSMADPQYCVPISCTRIARSSRAT